MLGTFKASGSKHSNGAFRCYAVDTRYSKFVENIIIQRTEIQCHKLTTFIPKVSEATQKFYQLSYK
jgi:hypothetical protein